MKLHVGVGSVYLKGYLNIDVQSPTTFLASQRPDLVEKWRTTEDKYYAKHKDKTQDALRAGPLKQEFVCDRYGDFSNLPVPAWSCEEVLARHCFEHLSIGEAHKALDQCDEVMKAGGILRLDVPDHEQTLKLYRETGDDFYIRHLLGPRRNDHGFHMMSYTRDRLRGLVEEHGFVFVGEEENIHFYPAFCLRFVKPGIRAPREYVDLPPIPDEWKMLDVGPGPFPHPRANAFLDKDYANLRKVEKFGQAIHGDLMSGLPEIRDREFDYVWCSHVLEHVENPILAARTLSRIAKAGTVVVPSVFKEMLFHAEELDHKWLVNKGENEVLLFVRPHSQLMQALRDSGAQKIACHIYRSGPNRIHSDQRYMRSFFYKNEDKLDIIVHWNDVLRVEMWGY